MLVTDQGQTIRIPVHDIRIAGRNTQGVRLFHTGADEHIVSTARLSESDTDEDDEDGGRSEAAATCPIACHCRRA